VSGERRAFPFGRSRTNASAHGRLNPGPPPRGSALRLSRWPRPRLTTAIEPSRHSTPSAPGERERAESQQSDERAGQKTAHPRPSPWLTAGSRHATASSVPSTVPGKAILGLPKVLRRAVRWKAPGQRESNDLPGQLGKGLAPRHPRRGPGAPRARSGETHRL
jgi:hypothetical protein